MTSVELAEDFLAYVRKYPEQRFWQALRSWSGLAAIHGIRVRDRASSFNTYVETFNWRGKCS